LKIEHFSKTYENHIEKQKKKLKETNKDRIEKPPKQYEKKQIPIYWASPRHPRGVRRRVSANLVGV
jgi:hypothetical protein